MQNGGGEGVKGAERSKRCRKGVWRGGGVQKGGGEGVRGAEWGWGGVRGGHGGRGAEWGWGGGKGCRMGVGRG